MKLGVFDSGLGGLLIAKAIREAMPDIDMCYLGDTLHLPYGNRSQEAITFYTRRGMDFLFEQGCKLIVIACNTASAAALRTLQREYLPVSYPDRNILGVIVPVLEEAVERRFDTIGLIGTNYIVQSNTYYEELYKLSPSISLIQEPTPLLVPLIENDGLLWIQDVLSHYLQPFADMKIEALILGCTHYPFLKQSVQSILGKNVFLLSQDDIIPRKLKDYLIRHPEYADHIAKTGVSEFFVTDLTASYLETAHKIYKEKINVQKVELSRDR